MEKVSGFVYIWRDRKHKRYYIGSHWGSPDDGYICSSSWMKQAYRKRSSDFKRRILTVVIESRQSLYDEEMRILGMIKDHELGKRYYNFKKRTGHWYINDARRVEIGQKISKAITGVKQSPEQIQKRKNTIASKPALTREQIVERRAKRLEDRKSVV